MTKIRVFARRPTPLNDLPIVNITDYKVPFNVDLYQQIDNKEPTLVHAETFTPATTPEPEPKPPEPEPSKNVDKFGIPYFHASKQGGFNYEMSNDPQNDQAMDHVDKEFTVANGVITMKPAGPTSFGVGKNIRTFKDSIGGCDMNFKETAKRGYANKPDDVQI